MKARGMGCRTFLPPLTGLVPSGRWFPRLKPWAIVGRPFGAWTEAPAAGREKEEKA
jgi:hypothetical protein